MKLHCCYGLSNLSSWAKCLTKLKILKVETIFNDGISIDFLLHLFQSSSNTLTKLEIKSRGYQNITQLLQQIPFYLRSLKHLVLSGAMFQRELLISILKSCTKLVYIRVSLDDDKSLKGLGKFIPKSLERIKFRLYRIDFEESLNCFLEEYINNTDDDNNNGALKYLEFNEDWNDNDWNDYYLEVTEKFGIQITEYKYQ